MAKHFRRSRDYCDETCPAVDGLADAFIDRWIDRVGCTTERELFAFEFARLIEDIKVSGTIKLRDALCSCIGDLTEAEAERDNFKKDVDRLNWRIEDLEVEVSELQESYA